MTNANKIQTVINWGFRPQTLGSKFYRDIYKETGFLEFWSHENPDVIQFYKNGEWVHDYVIDWSLFN